MSRRNRSRCSERLEPPTAEPVFHAYPRHEVVPARRPSGSWRRRRGVALRGRKTPSRAGTAPTWRTVVASTWIAGTLATFGIAAVRVRRFGRLLREARPAPRDVLDRVGELAGRLGLSRPPEVRMTPGAVSPMLWAPGCRPLLIVPDDLWERLDEARRDTLLVHELAHLKRRDHWVRGLELLATGLYWWHPVVWWSRRALHEAEEQCCDAWVVWAIPGAARTYAEALLDTVDFLSGAEPSVPWAASGLGHVRHLKRRLVMILNGTTPRALSWSGILATLGLCAAMLPLSPSWADEPPDPEPPEIVEERVERVPDPDRPEEDVLKFKFNFKLPDQAVIHEEIVTRVHEDALKPLQAQLDELSAKEELSKEDEIRRTAIEHAIQELKRALGDRSEDADPDPTSRRSGKARRERTDARTCERNDAGHRGSGRAGDQPRSPPDDSLGDDPKYQELRKKIAELESVSRRLRRKVRSPDDPAIRAQTRGARIGQERDGRLPREVAWRSPEEERRSRQGPGGTPRAEQRTLEEASGAHGGRTALPGGDRRLAEMERPDRGMLTAGSIPVRRRAQFRGPVTESRRRLPVPELPADAPAGSRARDRSSAPPRPSCGSRPTTNRGASPSSRRSSIGSSKS